MKKIIIIPIVSLILSGCFSQPNPSEEVSQSTPTYFSLKSEEYTPEIKLTGNIEAKKHIPITSKIVGRVDSVFVDTGDQVKKGQILARYSTIDNESQIAYQNALAQLSAAKMNSQNTIKSAEIQLQSSEKNFYKVKKEEAVAVKKAFDSLATQTQSTKTVLTNAIGFLDQTMGVSPRFRGTSTVSNKIGAHDMIGRQQLKNEVSQLVYHLSLIGEGEKESNQDAIIKKAKAFLNFLQEVRTTFLHFDSLIRKTTTSISFTETEKQSWQTKSTNFLSQLDQSISLIKNGINATKVQKEQSELKILSSKNALDSSNSQLALSQSMAESQIISARNQVNLSSSFQRELIVRAPFSGVITQKSIDQGQLVSPGQILFKLADISGFKIKTEIPDNQLSNISMGMTVRIKVDGLDTEFTGKITKINPAVDPQTRKIGIEVSLDGENTELLKIGLFSHVIIQGERKKLFFVPKSFLHYGVDKAFVLLEDGTEQEVDIGPEDGEKIAISFEGISENIKLKP